MIEFSEKKTYNAKIKFSNLGLAEDGLTLMWQLGFDYEGGVVVTKKTKVTSPEQIRHILSVLELNGWEEVPRKFARIIVKGKDVIAVGNLIEDKWIEVE